MDAITLTRPVFDTVVAAVAELLTVMVTMPVLDTSAMTQAALTDITIIF